MVMDMQRAFGGKNHQDTGTKRIHDFFLRRHVTHTPKTKKEKELPLQKVDRVKTANIPEIKRRLLPPLRARLEHLLQSLYNPADVENKTEVPVVEVPRSSGCPPQHALLSSQTVVCEPVSSEMELADPSRGSVRVFEVVELEKQRLRLIHWTRWHNEQAYARGYKCGITDLDHISAYLDAVTADCAATADIHASFYHVVLPPEVRCFYRFRDSAGNLYQLRVGAMGHCQMPEVMQIISNVLAGNPKYVQPEFAVHVPVQVWIDNIRHYGSRALVKMAQQALARNAADLSLETNIDPIRDEYDFIGGHFDHTNKTVMAAEKTLKKLPPKIPTQMRAGDVEQLASRLIFVAGLTQDPLVNHWWCLKWCRRVANRLNTGKAHTNEIVSIPPSAQRSLTQWLEKAHTPHKVVVGRNGAHATLFCDSTPIGYGGVLVTDDNRIYVTGGTFTEEQQQGSISAQETWGVTRSFHDFTPSFKKLNIAHLDVIVDNTSTEHNIPKGNTRSPDIVEPIKKFWQMAIGTQMRLRTGYVSTKIMPADEISRQRPLDIAKVTLAMRPESQNWRTGQAGRFVGRPPNRQ